MIGSHEITGTRKQYHLFYNYGGSVEIESRNPAPDYTTTSFVTPNPTQAPHPFLDQQPATPTLDRNNPRRIGGRGYVPRPSAVHATRGKQRRTPSPAAAILLLAAAGAEDARRRSGGNNPRFAGLLRSRRGAAARRRQRPPHAAARGSRGRGAVVVMEQGRKKEAGDRGRARRGAAASIAGAGVGTRPGFVNGNRCTFTAVVRRLLGCCSNSGVEKLKTSPQML
jgi:hypothetical protein